MGSPLSGLLADIYLNNYENKFIFNNNNILLKNIIFYGKYVDDIYIIFNGSTRQIDNLLTYMNSQNNKIQFTVEHAINNSLNFLDLNTTINYR